MNTAVIRPGILVALKTSMAGGVSYQRVDLASGKTEEQLRAEAEANGTKVPAVARWETTRVIDDPEEYARASKVRSLASAMIRKACVKTSFGLLCPTYAEEQLNKAAVEADALVRGYNETATTSRISVYVLKGRIAGTDEEAARAIVREVSELIGEMNDGISQLDPAKIRDAATRAQEMGAVLAPEQSEKVAAAVEQARKAARMITARVEKKGEEGAIVLLDVQRGAIEKARMSFLDLDVGLEAAGPAMPAVAAARFDLDLASDPVEAGKELASLASKAVVELDLEETEPRDSVVHYAKRKRSQITAADVFGGSKSA